MEIKLIICFSCVIPTINFQRLKILLVTLLCFVVEYIFLKQFVKLLMLKCTYLFAYLLTKKEQLVRDVNQYGADVCALQETKIENAGVHRVTGSMIITFDSKNKHYGNGFVVPKKWQESIHWR